MRVLNQVEYDVVSGGALPFGGIIGAISDPANAGQHLASAAKSCIYYGALGVTLGSWIGMKWAGAGGIGIGTIAEIVGMFAGGAAGAFLGFVGGPIVGFEKASEYYESWLQYAFGGAGGGNHGGSLG